MSTGQQNFLIATIACLLALTSGTVTTLELFRARKQEKRARVRSIKTMRAIANSWGVQVDSRDKIRDLVGRVILLDQQLSETLATMAELRRENLEQGQQLKEALDRIALYQDQHPPENPDPVKQDPSPP